MNESVDETTTTQARWWLVLVYVTRSPQSPGLHTGDTVKEGKGAGTLEKTGYWSSLRGTAEGVLELHQEQVKEIQMFIPKKQMPKRVTNSISVDDIYFLNSFIYFWLCWVFTAA